MKFHPGFTYHVYNQGNNRESIFFERADYLLFLKKMKKALNPHCFILAWCLMPNHFHWLINVREDYQLYNDSRKALKALNPLNKGIGSMLSSYTQSINQKRNRSGSLFRKRTKAKCLNEDEKFKGNYGINCFFYIHQNPLRAGLVKQLGEWEFSSYRDYAGIRNGTLCKIELVRDLFDLPGDSEAFKIISKQTIPDQAIQKLY
jgi:REP element-mobilizing transposase RayT